MTTFISPPDCVPLLPKSLTADQWRTRDHGDYSMCQKTTTTMTLYRSWRLAGRTEPGIPSGGAISFGCSPTNWLYS